MDRETLLKRTAIASARVQAAAIRLAEAAPGVDAGLLERVRAPYGKREARACNLMEAVADVLDVVSLHTDMIAIRVSEPSGATGGILPAGDLPLVGEASPETIFPNEIPGAIPPPPEPGALKWETGGTTPEVVFSVPVKPTPPAELIGDAAEVVVVTSEAVVESAPAADTPAPPTPRTGKGNRK